MPNYFNSLKKTIIFPPPHHHLCRQPLRSKPIAPTKPTTSEETRHSFTFVPPKPMKKMATGAKIYGLYTVATHCVVWLY